MSDAQPIRAGLDEHYMRLHGLCADVLTQSFTARLPGISDAHTYGDDLAQWNAALIDRPERVVLGAAAREYQFGLLALVQGLYRHAFIALRLYLELGFATVYFSGREYELRLWMRGQKDILWRALIDTDTGVLALDFVRAFSEGLAEYAVQHRVIAEKVYRECSEFVHGNAETHEQLPDTIAFRPEVVDAWLQRAESSHLAVCYALSARYLVHLDAARVQRLEPVLIDRLGHLQGIRQLLGAATEA